MGRTYWVRKQKHPSRISHQSGAHLHRHCTTMLQGHTALVCSLQLTPHTLVTGGVDGCVLAFALPDLHVPTDSSCSGELPHPPKIPLNSWLTLLQQRLQH